MEVTNQLMPHLQEASKIDPIVAKETGIPEKNQFQEPAQAITKEMVTDKVAVMNEFLVPTETNIKFQLHEQLEVYYVQVIDTKTDEVLREIPNRKFLDMYASMAEITGMMIDEKR
ncbi:flagellar protein FlaG [Planococcus sp. A6]|uniref:flagellar protein FlaG n=1 Tax=Planococcus sp. A6 TaxID=2992760 RepID=UPI00237C32E4|nr:flagellar protein FlaG [Planococcus sp. A6]MDE0583209.1 flagellar protein FlaG [Planococcus sp. A6]